jgi:hypothetical protein
VYRVLLEKPEEQSQFGRAKHRWEDYISIKLTLNRMGRNALD